MQTYSEFFIKPPRTQGLNNLTQIPQNQPLIIASTHLSDIDVQTVAANIAPYRNVGIASQASNQRDFLIGSFLRLAGIANVFGITNEYDSKKHLSHYKFNHEDFEIMNEAIKKGKTIVIAAHNPTYNWKLPEKPGKGAVYLAQLSNAMILPAALDIQSDMPIGMADDKINSIKRFILGKKPNARIIIGKPIKFSPIEQHDLKQMADYFENKIKNQFKNQDLEKIQITITKIKEQAQTIMKVLADMLPQEKRAIANL